MINKVAVVLCISGVLFITFGSHNVKGESNLAKAVKQPIQIETFTVSEDKVESNYTCPNGNENCHDDTYHHDNCTNPSNSWNCSNGDPSCDSSTTHRNQRHHGSRHH